MNIAGGTSVPSVSSSDSYEVVNDASGVDSFPAQPSPRLGEILTKYGSSLREGAFEDGMKVSIMDLGFDVTDSSFTTRGKTIIREAERASMEAMSGAAQVSVMNKAMDPSSPAVMRMGALGMMHAPVEPAAFKVPKREATEPKFLGSARDPLNYFVHMKTQESFSSPGSDSSAMGLEAKGREDSADRALALMGDPQRIVALPGYESIPLANSIPLLKQALVLAGVKSTIDSACSAVGKLKIWLIHRYNNYLDFRVPAGILAWFFDDSKVGGFCPPNLRSGLVWASRHMGFSNLRIEDEGSVKGATQAKPVRPTPAVSASVKMWWALECAAIDPQLSSWARYYAAAFCVRIIAALRGIDAQRSSVVEKFATFWHCSAYDSKTPGRRVPMPWAMALLSLSGAEWWSALEGKWENEFLFPGLNGSDIITCTGFLNVKASSAQALRSLRAILAHMEFGSEDVRKVFKGHSFRHLLPHAARAIAMEKSRCDLLGRWGWLKAMSVRYAAEVEFAATLAAIEEIMDAIRACVSKVPIHDWPPIGGWELLVHAKNDGRLTDIRKQLSVLLVEKGESDGSSDDEEEEGAEKASRPKRTATPVGVPREWEVPEGWSLLEVTSRNGKPYKVWSNAEFKAKPQSKPALYRFLSAFEPQP